MTPAALTLKTLRELGYTVGKLEHRIPYTNITQDVFGLDYLAVHPVMDAIGIQVTSGANHAARLKKLRANEAAQMLARDVRVEVWSWRKAGKRGERKVWTLRRERI